MKIAEGLIYLATELTGLKQGFDEAEGKTESWTSNLGGKVKGLLTGVVAGAAAVAATAIIAIGAGAMDVSLQTRTAASDMAASLGIPREEAEKFAEVAKRVYGDNLGDSVSDTAAAVGEIAKQFKLAANDPALETITKNALKVRDTFDIEIGESVSAVKTLMDNFGISADEAFDLIVAGQQRGLNRSGDLIDTIEEYSTQFANGGASAQEFFGLLETGMQGGMLGTDKVADLFKEFRIRLMEGSDDVATWLDTMEGIVDSGVLVQIRNGTMDVADVFPKVIEGLQSIEDPIERHKAGLALMGTQWEDMGEAAVLGIQMTEEAFANVNGATDSLNAKYETFAKAGEGIWRRLVVSVSPLTDKLLELVNQAMPAVMGAFDKFDATVGPAVENAGRMIDNAVQFIKGAFGQFRSSVDEDATGPLVYWKQWADENLPRLQQIFQFVLGAIQGFWETHGAKVMSIITNTFTVVFSVIDTTLRTVGDLVTAFLQLLTGDFEGMGQTLIGIVGRIWETVVLVFRTQLDSIFTLFGVMDWEAAGAAIINGVKSGIAAAWGGLIGWFTSRLQGLRNLLPFSEPKDPRSPLRGLPKSGASVVQMFGGGMMDEMERLRSSFSGGLAGLVGGSGQVAAAAGGDTFNVTISLDRGGYEEGRKAGEGFKDALRRRGGKS